MNNKRLTLGSLFSGSGGFELAGMLAGIEPVWNSEVAPFPVLVTHRRLPQVKHYGDVSKLKGSELEPVDIITFGSPCFPAGTLVLTTEGCVPIEEVRIGMKVLTHRGRWRAVTATGWKEGETVVLHARNGMLECTPNHPIYSLSPDKETVWIPAAEMKGRLWAIPRREELRRPAEDPVKEDKLHLWYQVESITPTGQTKTVYNLTVEEDNSYVADGIVVHNCQDLSIAGKRAGIQDGARSSLFFDAIRIIKEMRQATGEKYPRYCVWENVCFHEDTLVTCENGYKRIKEVHIGDRVKTHTGRFMPVMKVYQNRNQPLLKLKVSGAEDVFVTPNHPFLTVKKVYSKKSIVGITEPEWVPAGELTEKHLIGYRIDVPALPENFMTEDEAWAVGRWIADGSVDLTKSNPRMFFSIGIGKEADAREHLSRLPYSVYENKPHPTATNFCFTSHEFYSLISEAGVGAGNKRVPPYVFQLPFRLQKAVLEGYLSGDGYIRQRGNCVELAASTASRELAYGIMRLIRNVYRVAANISLRKISGSEINGREIHANYPCYGISASLTNTRSLSVIDTDVVWQPVKAVEPIRGKHTVYNLSVLEDNTYAANDIIVHNCGAFSSNGGDDFKAVLEAIIGIKEAGVEVPAPENHRWPKADVYLGDGWSLAYRTFDAQWWGTPQRRKRIYLVADFAGGSAGEVLFKSEGLSGYSAEGFRAWQRAAGGAEEGAGTAGGRTDVRGGENGSGVTFCINPQGNSGVGITEDKTLALVAQDHGNHPSVLQAAGFCTEHSAKARSIGYEEEKSPTLRAGVVPAALAVESNPTDSRVKISEDGVVQTLTQRMGTGGNNTPLVAQQEPVTMKIRGGKEGGGKGILCQRDKSATLGCNNDQTLFQPEIRAFGVCSKSSHAMLSDNPRSGFYEAKVSRTLDQSGGNAVTSAQGGIAVVAPDPSYAIQGSMIGRTEKNGPQGDGVNEEVSFTLNTVDRHAVAAPSGEHYSASKNSHFTSALREQANTLVATDYKDPPLVNDTPNEEPVYIVRRLTPVECARLQGFPDWWCDSLAIPEPTDEELVFWTGVWETWRKITNPDGRPKTEKQVRKWLADPYTDSEEYRLWGNGVFLGNAYFVLAGVAWAAAKDK